MFGPFFIFFCFPQKQGRSDPCSRKLNWSGLTAKSNFHLCTCSCNTVITALVTGSLPLDLFYTGDLLYEIVQIPVVFFWQNAIIRSFFKVVVHALSV